MAIRRITTIAAALGLLTAACGGGGGTSSSAASELELTTGAPEVAENADLELEVPETAMAGVDEDIELLIQEATTLLEDLATECAEGEGKNQPGADLSNRVFTGPDLRCADLSGANLENAVLEGVDISGANLSGANLTGATINVVAVGTDFTGAVVTDTDFGDSNLLGARFAGATITATMFPDNPVSLTKADFTGASIGCGRLYGGPGIVMTGVVLLDDCASSANYERLTVGGSFYNADLGGFDLGSTMVVTGDFRRANLAGLMLAEYGILPDGMDFSGSVMLAANLSDVAIHDALFVGTDMSQVLMTNSLLAGSDLSGAILNGADLTNLVSERNSYVGASFIQTTMTNASVSYDDFSGASFEQNEVTGLVVDTISCPDAVSNSQYGLCLVENSMVF